MNGHDRIKFLVAAVFVEVDPCEAAKAVNMMESGITSTLEWFQHFLLALGILGCDPFCYRDNPLAAVNRVAVVKDLVVRTRSGMADKDEIRLLLGEQCGLGVDEQAVVVLAVRALVSQSLFFNCRLGDV
ncbi:hypothetical protein C4577_04305 [Candidatus Parcubacteria bacterium]|nr:MAG: hypothetical protein C4577_04305 [Candidatus Parcubacteria bacterium]